MKTLEQPPTVDAAVSSSVADLLPPSATSSNTFAAAGQKLLELFGASEIAIWSTENEAKDAVLRAYARRPGLEARLFMESPGLDEAVQFVASVRGTSPMLWSEQSRTVADGSHVNDGNVENEILLSSIQSSDGRSYGVFALRPAPPASNLLREASVRAIEELVEALRADRQMDRMRRSERTHDALIYRAPIVVCSLDRQCNLTLWNPAAEQLFGWRVAEVLGRRLPFIRHVDRAVVDLYCRGALAGEATQKFELKCVTRSGSQLSVAMSVLPLFDERQAPNGVLIVASNLTERKQAEARYQLQTRVAESLARAHSMDESLDSILTSLCEINDWEVGEYWAFDAANRRLTWRASSRPRSAAADQYDTAIRGRGYHEVNDLPNRVANASEPVWLPGFAADRAIDRALLAARCGLNDAIGFRVVYANTTLGVMLFTAQRIERPEGQFLRCLQTIGEQVGSFIRQQTLVSNLRLAEENELQLKRLDTISTLVGGFVHDFNNLMTVILGYGDMLREKNVDQDLAREAAVEMFEAAKQASTLTRQLLAISRKTNIDPVPQDLNSAIQQLQPMLRRTIAKETEIRCDLAPRLRQVAAPPGHLEQLLMNLATNARDAIGPSGRFTISTREIDLDGSRPREYRDLPAGSYVALTVEDTGCGMSDAIKERIFDRFFTTKPAGKGTGIGLATVREIVTRCDGHILVESAPDQGTKFELLFPGVKDGLQCWVVESQPRRLASGTEKIFIVDDDAAVCRLVRMVLSAQGYSVRACENSKQAMAATKAQRGASDLLVIDLTVAGALGSRLVTQMLSENPRLRVLCVGDQGTETEKWPVLEKPFTSHELAAKVREVLDAN
jgi:PAS domain S-box-containing protein